eukprot:GFUD01043206.1.p1 GENE.GFUD01043206.1~~GFUD01043206.1.p1  ORF type:complete len:444 (-),score=152.81 GFUD01043206.1:340-1671(-)
MSELEAQSVMLSPPLSSPSTPEPPGESATPEAPGCSKDCDSTPINQGRGKKRHRRAKGKKKKQKTCLMITNDDGTNSTVAAATKQQKKVYLRPSNNPLLKAPKNSTQFIIDDHENSNLFWNFDAHPDEENTKDGTEGGDVGPEGGGEEGSEPAENQVKDGQPKQNQGMAVMPGQFFGLSDCDRFSPDDDNFWAAYSERDFESVYETAHQEEIYSWERGKIIDEISVLEIKQKQLINMLSQIDPLIYLQKLQHELLALQEQNRQLKLVNIAERLERQVRGGGSSTSSPRLPDSTTEREGEESKDTIEESETEESGDETDGGGCSSGCCLAENCSDSCDEENLGERLEELENCSDGGEEQLGDGESFEKIGDVEDEDTRESVVKKEEKSCGKVTENEEENVIKSEDSSTEIVPNEKDVIEKQPEDQIVEDVNESNEIVPDAGQAD